MIAGVIVQVQQRGRYSHKTCQGTTVGCGRILTCHYGNFRNGCPPPSCLKASQSMRRTAPSWSRSVLTMHTRSELRSRARDGATSSLSVAIEGLNLARELSSITLAKAAFGSVSVLLAMIKVCFLFFCDGMTQTHVYPGHHGQKPGLCRTRARLRGCMRYPSLRDDQEKVEWVESVHVRGD